MSTIDMLTFVELEICYKQVEINYSKSTKTVIRSLKINDLSAI